MNQFNQYSDENLTIPFTALQTEGGGVYSYYLGSPDDTMEYYLEGEVDLVITPADNAESSGHETNEIKLSLTNDFTGKVAGDPLTVPMPIQGGTAGKIQIFVELTDLTGGGVFSENEISLTYNLPIKQRPKV